MRDKKTEIAEYVSKTAELLDLEIKPDYLTGVIDNFTKLAEIATLVTEFDLPETIEPAATFKP